MKKVIITGDDFGLALPVNEAIEEAHRRGVLTTASLMVGERFFADAVERAKKLPRLRVGLHLTLVEGTSILPPEAIPNLVDANRNFPVHLTRAGFRFFFSPAVRNQLEIEIRAQFETFLRTGLLLDHVNAHNHMHLHPTVLGLILKVGRDYGLKAIRLPNEPPWRSWRAARDGAAQRFLSWIFLFPWLHHMKAMMRRSNVSHNDYLFGMNDSGAMTLDLVLRMVSQLPPGVTEFCFHPATRRSAEIERSMPRYKHEEELRAITSETLRRKLRDARAKTIAFSDL